MKKHKYPGKLGRPISAEDKEVLEAARSGNLEEWIAQEWTELFEGIAPSPVPLRWSGPLVMLQKGHDYLTKGNVSASQRILKRLETQPFFEAEIKDLGGH